MEWIVTLSGNYHALEELSKVFNNHEICIQKDNDRYVLKDEALKELSTEEEVRKKTEELLQSLRGPVKLALGNESTIQIDHIAQIHADGRNHYYTDHIVTGCGNLLVKTKLIHKDGTIEEDHPADPIVNWLILSRKDQAVKEMFEQLSDDFKSWHGIYNLFEMIQKDIGNIPKKGWCDSRELRKFKRTANSREAVGVKARHGKDYPAPPEPMSLPQAKRLLDKIIKEWLQEKSIQNGL